MDVTDFSNSIAYRNKFEQQSSKLDRQLFNQKLEDALIEFEDDSYKIAAINEIKSLPDETNLDFDFKQWLYNEGFFRTEKEIKEYLSKIEDYKYLYEGGYEEATKHNWIAYILIFLCFVALWIFIGVSGRDNSFAGFILLITIIACPVSLLIFAFIDSSMSVDSLKLHGATPDDERLKTERKTMLYSLAVISMAGASAFAIHRSNKAYNRKQKYSAH